MVSVVSFGEEPTCFLCCAAALLVVLLFLLFLLFRIGLFSDTPAPKKVSLLDSLADVLAEKCAYGPEERDMIAMEHKFRIQKASGEEVCSVAKRAAMLSSCSVCECV